MQVKKRDGSLQPYDFNKIKNAVNKAFLAVTDNPAPESFIETLKDLFDGFETLEVEKIQDEVENTLMRFEYYDIMRAYDRYRTERTTIRNRIQSKIEATNVQNQNANVDEASFGGRIGEADNAIMKELALNDYMSEMARNNHLKNEVYIHDLDKYAAGMHNCLTIPFDDLLAKGFIVRNTDVRPAASVSTAMQLVAVIFQCQSLEQFGGVSASHIDWTMVPYVRLSFYKHFMDGIRYIEDCLFGEYDKERIKNLSITDEFYTDYKKAYDYACELTEREVYQAVEGLYHNLNTLQSRSG